MPNGKTPKELGYETQDVQWPLVLWTMGSLIVIVLVSIFGLLLLFSKRDQMIPQPRGKQPMTMAEERPIPTGPLLQARPPVDMKRYLDQSNAHMESFGWVDEASGKVHVPIERAMELALEQGFPTGAPAPVATETPEPEAPAAAEAPDEEEAGEDAA